MKRVLLHAAALSAVFLAAGSLRAQIDSPSNLVPNGDFNGGYTGFQSDYTQWPGQPSWLDEGQFAITQDLSPHPIIQGWGALSGFGGPSDNFLFANGASDTTQSPWYLTMLNPPVTLTTDPSQPVYYRFEAQVANTDPAGWAPPSLSFEISLNGGSWSQLTLSPDLSSSQDNWTLVYADGYFTSQPASVSLRLRNASGALAGNDFALDNIYFGLTPYAPSYLSGTVGIQSTGNFVSPTSLSIPEPSSWALLGTGVSVILLAARGRKFS